MCLSHDPHSRCLIPPSPELRRKMQEELKRLQDTTSVIGPLIRAGEPKRPGLNDGVIIPGDRFPLGTPFEVVRSAAAERAPLRGAVRVIVVLVEFADRPMAANHHRQHFHDLFFSQRVLASGSVREYFAEVSGGLVDIVGEVVGPYRLPLNMAQYANGQSGTGPLAPNARTMARHAAEAANPFVNFKPYDNDGNGFVDAFVVIHAGLGGEETGNGNDIWSHKWVLPNGEYNADGTKVYPYLTVPENARIGVCCHELGHLLFGWPDLYDIDGSSEGLGNWCLMAGGSWNGAGDVPAHPSAWCKARQGWISVVNQASNATLSIRDVKDGRTAYRLWKDGAGGKEYFLVENRQRKLFDRLIPSEGLLVYHVDETVDTNADERRPVVGLLQADGRQDLNLAMNRGDAGDPFPGSEGKVELSGVTTPNTRSNAGVMTGVAIRGIGATGPVMSARVEVRAEVATRRPRFRFPSWFRTPGAGGDPSEQARFEERRDELLRELVALYRPGGNGDGDGDGGREPDAAWQASIEERIAAIEEALGVGAPPRPGASLDFEPEPGQR